MRRSRTTLVIFFVLFAFIVTLSPLTLELLGSATATDWNRLSEIGQAYGAASAVLSALALMAIAASVYLQMREHETSSALAQRDHHVELVRMINENPHLLLPAWGIDPTERGDAYWKRFLFITLTFNYGLMAYTSGISPEADTREEMIRSKFASEPVREWWSIVRPQWEVYCSNSSRRRRFFQIMDEEYKRAISQGPSTISDHLARTDDPHR